MKNTKTSSRRDFLRLRNIGKQEKDEKETQTNLKPERIKMLTPDGQLVEVDKSVVEKANQFKKASNDDILQWTNNIPSKKS